MSCCNWLISILQGFLYVCRQHPKIYGTIINITLHWIWASVGIWLHCTHTSACCIKRQHFAWHSKILSSTERCWAHPASDQSSPSPYQPRHSRIQTRLAMAARQQRPAAAADGSAEARRTDVRTNEKKCCEWFVFPLCVKCWLISWGCSVVTTDPCAPQLLHLLNIMQQQRAVNCPFNHICCSVGGR